jgi:hypothetical protein
MGLKVTIAGVVALLCLGAVWAFGLATPDAFDLPTPFSSSRWKATDGSHYARCSMAADLTHRIGLIGRSEDEVVSLLGKPEGEQNGFPIFYELCPSLADTYILELTRKSGRVASVAVRDT